MVVLAAALSSLITGVFLVVQNWLQNRREDRRIAADRDRRKEERQTEEKRRKADRRDALDDHWRDARHRAHVDLLAQLRAVHDETDNQFKNPHPPDPTLGDDWQEQSIRGLTEVQLVASPDTRELAEHAWRTAGVSYYSASVASYGIRTTDESVDFRKRASEHAIQALKALDAYQHAVRRELGIVHPE